MKGDRIPNQDHVARYCSPLRVEKGEVLATAFMIRTGDENLSVNWIEYFKCTNRESEIAELRKTYSTKKLAIKAGGRIAVLNVGKVLDAVATGSQDNRKLEVLHDPQEEDLSHSGIYNLRHDDELIAELIRESILEIYPARQD